MEAKRCQSPFLIFSKNIIMKKLLFSFLMLAIPLMASAQIRMGYFSYNAILTTMTDYELAKRSVDDLRLKYDAEMKRSEKEFNDKYEVFLEVQRDLVPSILRKRQAELQEMMEKNTAFKNDAIRLLEQAENDALAPVNASSTKLWLALVVSVATYLCLTPTTMHAHISTQNWARMLQRPLKRQ